MPISKGQGKTSGREGVGGCAVHLTRDGRGVPRRATGTRQPNLRILDEERVRARRPHHLHGKPVAGRSGHDRSDATVGGAP